MQYRCAAIIERMRQGRRRLHPRQSEAFERQPPEQRRHDSHGVNRRADVVVKTWERDLGGAAASADCVFRFEHEHRVSGLGEHYSGGQAIRAGPHDDRIVRTTHRVPIITINRSASRRSTAVHHLAEMSGGQSSDEMQGGKVLDGEESESVERGLTSHRAHRETQTRGTCRACGGFMMPAARKV